MTKVVTTGFATDDQTAKVAVKPRYLQIFDNFKNLAASGDEILANGIYQPFSTYFFSGSNKNNNLLSRGDRA